ncbi:MAG: TIGR02147 family protein [Fibrobacteria bacterium]
MSPIAAPPNILMYSDYRVFLREYYETRKSVDPHFSYRYLSQKAGINSSAFYKYIIDGKRSLTKTSILKTCMALKLKDKEAEYFENLVFFNQAETIKEKNVYFDKLTRLRGNYDKRRVKEDQYAFYAEWHHSAVRELLGCMAFTGDYADLAGRLTPAITPRQAEESLILLARLGMSRKDAQGRWRQADPVLTTDGQVEAGAIVEFQRKMLKLADAALDTARPRERLMSSTTFGISEETMELFRKKIRDLKFELMELARLDQSPTRAYQLNVNLFPLSETTEAGKP